VSVTHHVKAVSPTERLKKAQAQARALRQELRRGRRSASVALAEVEALRRQVRHMQRLASLGMQAAMVAHEFNNILTPMINYAQIARKNPRLMDKALTLAANGGLRATDLTQWKYLTGNTVYEKNIIIFLQKDAYSGGFADANERDAFFKQLSALCAQGKNVFVFAPGANSVTQRINGVRYFTVSSPEPVNGTGYYISGCDIVFDDEGIMYAYQ